jgi:hypothetical protein
MVGGNKRWRRIGVGKDQKDRKMRTETVQNLRKHEQFSSALLVQILGYVHI